MRAMVRFAFWGAFFGGCVSIPISVLVFLLALLLGKLSGQHITDLLSNPELLRITMFAALFCVFGGFLTGAAIGLQCGLGAGKT